MRTRGPSHDETKQRILEVARELVLESGPAALSLREVARRAGFVPSSLYEYFDGKDAIVAELARAASASLKLALERCARKGTSGIKSLEALGMGYVAWARSHPEDFLLHFARLPSKRRSLDEPAGESPYALVLAAVRRAAEEGSVAARTPRDVEHLAYALWASAHGMAMLQLTHLAGFGADFPAADRAAIRALLEGWSR
jgi:AcrR family transcriptional regulator